MIITIAIVFALYCLSMMALAVGFKKQVIFHSEVSPPITTFSIVIPFRNESENLMGLLNSLRALNYPKELFEVLLVNDESEDNSEELIKDFAGKMNSNIHLLQNHRISNSPKKDAISVGINHSKYQWIATTDADCELPKNWLKNLDAFIEKQIAYGEENIPVMVCGPVAYTTNRNFIQDFQQVDGFSLQTVTIGSFGYRFPILCNGANLAYKKDAFFAVNGFEGNNHLASGDDIFLMEKMKKRYPKRVKFLKSKDNLVLTKPQLHWSQLINQRIRWASKTSKQNNPISMILGILVVLANIVFLLLPLLIVLDSGNILLYLFLIFLKIFTDLLVVSQTSNLFEKPLRILKFPVFTYIYSIILIIVFFRSLRGKYTWKDRHF